ncbi:MAG: hypothetical protein LBV26_08870 [Bacteroidales bacterium]|jgi:hypothetical protein|nr:hypothetical protein [Bacteroidales bacterium]
MKSTSAAETGRNLPGEGVVYCTGKASQHCESAPTAVGKVSQHCESAPAAVGKVSQHCESAPAVVGKVSGVPESLRKKLRMLILYVSIVKNVTF